MKRIALAVALLLTCLTAQADPSQLPDSPKEGDQVGLLVKTDDGATVGVDLNSAKYDKKHNVLEFLEVIMNKDHKTMFATKMAFACWDHKFNSPMVSVINMENGKIIHQTKSDLGWQMIKADTWIDSEYKMVCPKVKDPRATEL